MTTGQTAGLVPARAGHSDGFVFLGEVPAIDLVNTEVVVRGKARDLLATPEMYVAWWRAARERYPGLAGGLVTREADPDLLPTVKALRQALRAILSAVADGIPVSAKDLAVLNQILAAFHDAIALGGGDVPRPLRVPRGHEVDGPLMAIARSAFVLLTGTNLARLHRCANGRCILLFYDTTKSATRRWCSTACMNRARSTQRYRAQKGAARIGNDTVSPG